MCLGICVIYVCVMCLCLCVRACVHVCVCACMYACMRMYVLREYVRVRVCVYRP